MIKPLALAALTLTLPFIPAALGCSSSSSSPGTGDDTSYDSGTTHTDSGTHIDSGSTTPDTGTGADTGMGDDGAASCPASTTGFTGTTYTPVVAMANACSADEITAFIAACGDNGTDQTCGDWQTNAGADGGACFTCIFPPGANGPANTGATYNDVNGYFGPNYPGCVQLTDTTHGTACATALGSLTDCEGTACDNCSDNTSAMACYGGILMGGCSSFASGVETSCSTDLADGGAVDTCHPGGQSATDPDWTLILNLICGAGH